MHQRYISFLCGLLLSAALAQSQPYIDLLNVRYVKSPDMYLFIPSSSKTVLTYINVSTTLPLMLKNKDAFICSPYFENWKVEISRESKNYYGLVFPFSYMKNINDKWTVLTTGIIRWNDSTVYKGMRSQVGGAVIVGHKVKHNLTLKTGIYINNEFFGLFVMPLVGIDWQISSRDCLFGVLPGNLTYQHEVSKLVKYGFAFRAQTNSYHRQLRNFTRIDENGLGMYVDFYPAKRLVFNVEGGASLLRKIRTGKNIYLDEKYTPYEVNNNLYFKAALAYRISLR
jgi:hypothetical protein